VNTFKEVPKKETPAEKPSRPKKRSKIARSFVSVFSGSFLSKENVIRQLPFILFLTLIALVYIANGYYAEKTVRSISRINSELKELKTEYIFVKSELMQLSNQSEIAKAVKPLGLEESTSPPKKIVVQAIQKQKKTTR